MSQMNRTKNILIQTLIQTTRNISVSYIKSDTLISFDVLLSLAVHGQNIFFLANICKRWCTDNGRVRLINIDL